MTTLKTPEQITEDITKRHLEDLGARLPAGVVIPEAAATALYGTVIAAVEEAVRMDRAQRRPEIYIVQDGQGDVAGVFCDSDEATAAYGDRLAYSIVAETVSEPGEYAKARIEDLTREWEEATNWGADEPHRASDYDLSGDDWKAGLSDDDAAEIARLIEWQEAQK